LISRNFYFLRKKGQREKNAVFKAVISFLFKDIQWKLLSVGLALILWFVGMTVNNPTATNQFRRSLKLSNIDVLARDNIIILNERELRAEQIIVGVRGTQSELTILDYRTDNIEVSIDFRQVDPHGIINAGDMLTLPLDVYAEVLEGFERMYLRPRTVDVVLDLYIRQTHAVKVYEEGEVQSGYELISLRAVNETVTVSGARHYVNQVFEVRGQVNIHEANHYNIQTVPLYAVDISGEKITEVELSVRETNVHVSVLPYKTVSLEVDWSGTLAPGHIIKEIGITPSAVDIVGPADVLNELDKIALHMLDLTDANETHIILRNISQSLPNGVSLMKGQPIEAEIAVVIEPLIRREYIFPVDDIRLLGITAGQMQLITNEPARFFLTGAESDMLELTRDQIGLHLNLIGRSMGEHNVQLNFTLPPGITLSGSAPFYTVLITSPEMNGSRDDDTGEEEAGVDGLSDENEADTANGEPDELILGDEEAGTEEDE
jgi:YbbR domain-containing protein